MERLTSTPFGRRPVSAAQIAARARARTAAPTTPADKWQVLRDLTAARHVWNLSDRDLTVLGALLSCHPRRELDDANALVVYPSNATLSARAHGMAESTLRRHLAALVTAGFVLRHDSPNGKRYATRGPDGSVLRAFGFDLSPLLNRARTIAEAAEEARAQALRLKRLREEIVLRLRDCTKLLPHAAPDADIPVRIAAAKRTLRRRLDEPTLQALVTESARLLERIEAGLPTPETPDASALDSRNERHIQSQTQKHDSDSAGSGSVPDATARCDNRSLTLAQVTAACPDVQHFLGEPPRRWSDLVASAERLRPMLGIAPSAWNDARARMGPTEAAVTVACLLQSANRIRSPGGYLRALTKQAERGRFTSAPMVRRLLRELTAVNCAARVPS